MAKKRPRGRPTLAEGEAKDGYVGFRIDGEDLAALDEAAALAGTKRSDWCRDRLVTIARREIKRAESKKK